MLDYPPLLRRHIARCNNVLAPPFDGLWLWKEIFFSRWVEFWLHIPSCGFPTQGFPCAWGYWILLPRWLSQLVSYYFWLLWFLPRWSNLFQTSHGYIRSSLILAYWNSGVASQSLHLLLRCRLLLELQFNSTTFSIIKGRNKSLSTTIVSSISGNFSIPLSTLSYITFLKA